MNQSPKRKTKAERKQTFARVVCLVIAVVMVGSVLLAAVFSRVY